jgi:hypothetical protein
VCLYSFNFSRGEWLDLFSLSRKGSNIQPELRCFNVRCKMIAKVKAYEGSSEETKLNHNNYFHGKGS